MKRSRSLYMMSIPAVALITVFVFIPLVSGIRISLTDWNGFSQSWSYVGFKNYLNLFTDSRIVHAIKNTFYVGLGDTMLQNIFGLAYALLLNHSFRGRSVIRAIIYLPVMVSSLIMGYIWFFIVQYDNGALNDIIMLFGHDPVGLGRSDRHDEGDDPVSGGRPAELRDHFFGEEFVEFLQVAGDFQLASGLLFQFLRRDGQESAYFFTAFHRLVP